MKLEIKKLYYNNAFIVFLMIILISCFISGITYNILCTKNQNHYNCSFTQYENLEELQSIISKKNEQLEEIRVNFENNKIEIKEYEESSKECKKQIAYYQYMYDHKIAYGEATENMIWMDKIQVFFFATISPFLIVAFIGIITPLLSYFIFNYEMSSGVFKFVYIGKNKTKIVLKKYALFISIILLMALIVLLCFYFMSLSMANPFKMILSYVNGQVFAYSVKRYVFYEIISTLYQIIVMSTLFYSISIHIKNSFFLFLLDILIIGIFILFNIVGGVFGIFMQPMMRVSIIGYSIKTWLLAGLIVTILVVGLFILSLKLFKRKELV